MSTSKRRTQLSFPNGAILWKGASRIDGQPIVAIATGLYIPSSNPKTGPMIQTWIMGEDMHPYEAIKVGADISACGTCALRYDPETLKRVCYVNPSPLGRIYKSYLNNRYKPVSFERAEDVWFRLAPLRIGAYGDPTAIPAQIWIDWIGLLENKGIGWTGYTRRWLLPENQIYKGFLMASCFTNEERQLAKSLGWRTYQIIPEDATIPSGTTLCPGSKEAGYLKQCIDCLLCQGNSRDISVYAHGHNAERFITATNKTTIEA